MSDDDDCRKPLVVVVPSNPHQTRTVLRNSSSGGGAARTGKASKQRSYVPSLFAAAKAAPAAVEATDKPAFDVQTASKQKWRGLLAPFACLCWVACSSGAILVNKHILVDLNFPFPCTVAALGITGTSIISTLAVRLLRLGPAKGKAAVSWWFYCTYIVPAGLCVALAMQLGNTAYLYLSVAYVQMLKAFTPVVTMLFAFLFKLERPSLLLISAVGLITAGVAVASWGEGSFSVMGATAMAASLICEALRLVLMQCLVSKRDMHPVQTLAYIAPAATAWMLLIAGVTEALAIHQAQALHDIAQHPWALIASAAAGFGANAMAMLVISLSGALTLKCLGLAKDVGLVVVGVVVLGEVVSALQGVGYGISLLGFLLYNAARMWAGGQLGRHGGSRGAGSDSKARFSSGGSKSGKPAAAAGSKPARISGGVKDLLRAHYPGSSSSRESAEGRPLLRTPRTSPAAAGPRAGPSPRPATAALPPTSPAAASIPSSQRVRQAQGYAVAGWERDSDGTGTTPSGSGAQQQLQQQQSLVRSPRPAVAAAALPVPAS